MTRAIAVALVLFLAGGARAADEEARLASLHNATVQGDCARAAALVDALERAGDRQALMVLGELFETGRRCLGQDPARAARLYARAAERGEAGAMVRLGRLYAEGRGVVADEATARHWFRAAVVALAPLDAGARDRLLRMFLADGAVPALLEQQLTWLTLVEWGGPASVLDLARRIRTGDGVPRNEKAAEKLIEQVAIEGLVDAQYELGHWQAERAAARGAPCAPEATRYLLIAADNGHALAQAEIGRCYARSRPRGSLAYAYLWAAQIAGVEVAEDLARLEQDLSTAEIAAGRDTAVARGLRRAK